MSGGVEPTAPKQGRGLLYPTVQFQRGLAALPQRLGPEPVLLAKLRSHSARRFDL
jgi:hypothetical protein